MRSKLLRIFISQNSNISRNIFIIVNKKPSALAGLVGEVTKMATYLEIVAHWLKEVNTFLLLFFFFHSLSRILNAL